MAKTIGAVITLKDNMSATLRGIKKEQKAFKQDVVNTRKELERTFKKKIEARLDNTSAHKKLKQLKKDLEPLRKKIVTTLAYKDMITRNINKSKNELKAFGRMVFKPVIEITDKTSRVINSIKTKIVGLTKLASGIAIGGAVAVGGMMKSGAELEQQQISMQHFVGKGNSQMSEKESAKATANFMKQLRDNANATPFETGEVIGAGTRALGVVGGNIKEAMELVKVAEDMAALTPSKTVGDAMEALADAMLLLAS